MVGIISKYFAQKKAPQKFCVLLFYITGFYNIDIQQ
jgi:hypothetical protein